MSMSLQPRYATSKTTTTPRRYPFSVPQYPSSSQLPVLGSPIQRITLISILHPLPALPGFLAYPAPPAASSSMSKGFSPSLLRAYLTCLQLL